MRAPSTDSRATTERVPFAEHEGAALRPGVLQEQLHQPADDAPRGALARERLRRAHRGVHVELRAHGGVRRRRGGHEGRALGLVRVRPPRGRVARAQVGDHGEGAPAGMRIQRLVQVHRPEVALAGLQAQLGRELRRQGLDVQKAVLAGELDGLVVPGHRLVDPAADAGLLGLHDAQLVQEVRRATLREIPQSREAVVEGARAAAPSLRRPFRGASTSRPRARGRRGCPSPAAYPGCRRDTGRPPAPWTAPATTCRRPRTCTPPGCARARR